MNWELHLESTVRFVSRAPNQPIDAAPRPSPGGSPVDVDLLHVSADIGLQFTERSASTVANVHRPPRTFGRISAARTPWHAICPPYSVHLPYRHICRNASAGIPPPFRHLCPVGLALIPSSQHLRQVRWIVACFRLRAPGSTAGTAHALCRRQPRGRNERGRLHGQATKECTG